MAKVSWVHRRIYVVVLDDDEEVSLDKRSNQYIAGSTFLGYIITSTLLLTERIEDKKDDVEDKPQ